MKNDPALQVSWSAASSTIPLPERSASTASRTASSGARSPGLDPEGAGELGVGHRLGQVALPELEGDLEHDVAPGLGLEAAVRGSRSRSRRRRSVRGRRSRGPRCGRGRWSGRRPGHRRRRSGWGSSRPRPGCRTAPRCRPIPGRRAATSSSQSSPAATVSTTPPPAARASTSQASVSASTPLVATSHDPAVEALVGDDEVAAARQQQHGGRRRRRPRATAATSSASVVARDPLARRGHRGAGWCGRAGRLGRWPRARTALGMPSTFLPSHVTSSASVTQPVGDRLHGAADTTTSAPPSAGTTTGR